MNAMQYSEISANSTLSLPTRNICQSGDVPCTPLVSTRPLGYSVTYILMPHRQVIKLSVQNNFTMFGVGCSFSDSPTEQMHRTEIMDQASRGWFSSGQLSENNINRDTYSPKSGECEDDVKKPTWTIPKELDNENFETKSDQSHMHRSKNKSLIDHMIPRNKR